MILVTGGTGYIGSHACVALAQTGLAYEKLGWKCKRGIDQMCADAWRWQQRCDNPVSTERVSGSA